MDFEEEFKLAVGELQLKPYEFWELTLAEFADIIDGYVRMQKRRTNELLYTAWHTAVLSRMKDIPSLKSILQDTETKPKHEQTGDEMLAMCKLLNAAFGGEVVET